MHSLITADFDAHTLAHGIEASVLMHCVDMKCTLSRVDGLAFSVLYTVLIMSSTQHSDN